MVSYTTNINFLAPELKELITEIDPFEWCNLFAYVVEEGLKAGMGVTGEGNPLLKDVPNNEQLYSSCHSLEYVINTYPVLFIDPNLDHIIEDTVPDLKDIHLPYNAFYINKRFKFRDGYIMGIAVYNVKKLTYDMILEQTGDDIESEMLTNLVAKLPGLDDDLPEISFDMIYVDMETGELNFFIVGVDEVNAPPDKEIIKLLNTTLKYAVNVSSLIINKVNRTKPDDPKRDYRLINHYPKFKAVESKNTKFSYLRVFGDSKKYITDYNKAKRKYSGKPEKSFLVRGHWRNYQSERYTNVRGEKKWIMPYIKGVNRELHQKLIKVVE